MIRALKSRRWSTGAVRGNVAATRNAAHPALGLTMEHQREQAVGFGFIRQEPSDQPAEPDRFFR